MKPMLLLMVLLAASFALQAEESLYIQGRKVSLLAEPAFNAERLIELARGTEVTVLSRRGTWYQVSVADGVGWVPKLLLSQQSPIERVNTVFSGEEKAVEKSVRRRASNVTTAGAARGLKTESRRRASRNEAANFSALEWMEGVSVSEDELAQFMKEGLQ